MHSSKRVTPARQAATFSPMEWPTIAAGFTPQDSQSCASAYSTIMISGNCTEGCFSLASAATRSSGFGSQIARMS